MGRWPAWLTLKPTHERLSSRSIALTASRWQGAPGTVNANDYDLFRERYRLGKVFTMQQRGSTCFDFDYYRANSPDLPSALDAEVWRHFLEHGQFEGRLFRSAASPGAVYCLLPCSCWMHCPLRARLSAVIWA